MNNTLMKYVRLAAFFGALAVIILYTYRHHVYMWMTVGGMPEAPITVWVPGFIRYMLWPWIATLIIALASYSAGHFVLGKLGKVTYQGASVLYCLATGMGVMAVMVWILGWLHLLYSGLLVVLILGCIGFGWKTIWGLFRNIKPAWSTWKWWDIGLLILIALFIWRTMFLSANPSIGHDATATHLFQAKHYLDIHVIRYSPLFSFIALQHMLTVLQFAIGIPDPGSILPYFAMVMASAGLFFLGERYFSRTAGLLGVLAYLLQPMSFVTSMQWFTAHMLIMYVVLMMMAILRFWETVTYGKDNRRQRSEFRWIIIAGLMGGFACAVKITGLIPVAILIMFTGRQWWRTLLWVVIACSPWYLVNLIHFGNPVFPHYEQWFGWLKFGIQEQVTQFQSEITAIPAGFYPWTNPWALTFYTNAPWAQEGQLSEIGPFLFAFTIPLFFMPKKNWKRPAIFLALFCLISYAYWYFNETSFLPRYLLYIFALHGLLAAYGVSTAIRNMKHIMVPLLIVLLTIFGYAVTLKYAFSTHIYVPMIREAYLQQNLPALQLFRHINENNPDWRVYEVGFRNYRFFAEFDLMDDQYVWHTGDRYRFHNEEALDLHDWLLSHDRTHIIVNEGNQEMWYNERYVLPRQDPEFDYYFQPALRLEDWLVYEVMQDPERAARERRYSELAAGETTTGETSTVETEDSVDPDSGG